MARRKSGSTGAPGRLRIIGGEWRSRVLPVADVDGLRPTPARVRETLFNWLAPSIDGARCLDLCAGSGALGIEALSRGAASAIFVEQSSRAAAGIERALAELGAAGASVVRQDAVRFLAGATPQPADIVFLDPPYAAGLLPELCRLLAARGWLAPGARIYLEYDRKGDEPALPAGWRCVKSKEAGNVSYRLYEHALPDTRAG